MKSTVLWLAIGSAIVAPGCVASDEAASPGPVDAGRSLPPGPELGPPDCADPRTCGTDASPGPRLDAGRDAVHPPSDGAPDAAADRPDAAPLRTDAAPVRADAAPDAAPDRPDAALAPIDTTLAAELYGLKVGARWTYLRSGDVLRWKEITGCEDVVLRDIETGERSLARAYVRENRSVFGVTSVHYLIVDERGVHRVRRDDVDEGNLVVFTTYEPAGIRLLNGPWREGDALEFDQRAAEWMAWDDEFRGATETSAIDVVLGESNLALVAGTFRALGIERQWAAFNQHNVRSYYVPGVGEVLEQTIWPAIPPRIQIEELVDFTPGHGTCEPSAVPAAADAECGAHQVLCDDPWGTGVRGCTDPRVDPDNCGGCGLSCPSRVCSGGVCLESECDLSCAGTTLCCPSAWRWGAPGCTQPSRDRWNCGGCGVVCAEGLICDHGQCVCGPGRGDCAGTGACRDLLTDTLNCGECGRACGGDRPVCDKGVCVDSCLSADLATCGDDCVDLAWNNDHCGACGQSCGRRTGTTECVAGVCQTCAAAGLTDCDGDCADLLWSDKHCGACGRDCDGDEVCVFGACRGGDGSCAEPCAEGDQICCEGQCIDPRTNDHACGGCGVAQCAGGCTEACRDGRCVPVECGGGDD